MARITRAARRAAKAVSGAAKGVAKKVGQAWGGLGRRKTKTSRGSPATKA
jgi:hypothetical protein